MIDTRQDPAFRPHASGLLVPAELSREREVWTRQEWKLLDRAAKLVTEKHLDMFLGCRDDACKGTPIERRRNPDGGLTLRCQHKDRVVLPGL